ncbi:aminopeptidase [Alkalispirochaeta americana]|uniref:Aminopeptidase n=1 Tax=Alkalispirochaeta americana TaxID=159291 RepID=A0A1N6P108_9SPIO|nr:aminopeptidase [Alkalispirochaeta americana]SIP97822.1 aminopeptidase [Alkalispirochaeta americana]
MEIEKYLERFAHVALAGVNLQQGQPLAIKVEPENLDAAVVVASLAYQRGASYVDLWTESSRLLRTRLDFSGQDHLSFVPSYRESRNKELLRDRWALLSIKSPVDPSVLDGADTGRMGAITRALSETDAELRRGLSNDETQWTVMAVPSPKWAGAVLNMPPGEEALHALWEAFVPILRLDADDPARFWKDHGAFLAERARTMTELKIRELHFSGAGTDLTVGLSSRARWKGGGARTSEGIEFSPNLPTEEVFTTPDYRQTRGRAAISRPVRVMGTMVRDAWMEFDQGKVVNFGASSGKEALREFLEVDRGSSFMGEIALVDSRGPIFQSGLLFDNILLDENAACHFALGFAYPSCIEGGTVLDDKTLDEIGANRSRQHLDFMIGTEAMEVRATLQDGSTQRIIERGRFVS